MGFESQYIWMDGEMTPFAQATVHFLNPTLHYGTGVFEGIRCYNTPDGPAVFRLKEHVHRLFDSARVLGFRNLPYSEAEIRNAIRQVVTVNGFEECYIRPLLYMGMENVTFNVDFTSVHIGIAAWAWGAYLGDAAREQGVRANVSSFARHHLNASMTKAKITGNYANSSLAKTESVRLGFDEAIMLDGQGYVAECTGENLFVVRGEKIITPPMAPVLEGITRDALIQLAAEQGYTVVEAPVSRDQLYTADELFVCGTAAEVVAIREVDFRTIGSGVMGPVTRQIQQVYHQVIHGGHPLSARWLDYVDRTETIPAD